MHQVAILAYDQLATFELGCAIELFALPRPEYRDWYQTDVVCLDSPPLRATGGIEIQARQIDSLAGYQTLVVPGWGAENKPISPQLAAAILQLHQRGGRIISLCSGAFLLAELGLFNSGQATTHWRYAKQFKQRFPDIEFVDDVLYLLDGQIGCSAGSAAGIDLGLEIIRQDYGYQIANQVARRLVLPTHRNGGQAQFVETPMVERHQHFAQTLDWALQQLDQTIDVDQLATHAHMSRRSFDRHFRAALGISPQQWLNQQRLARAQRYLEQQKNNMDWVANQCGFGSAINMRHHFRKTLGISPSQYRQQFSSI